jgi:hypothetical protein
MRIGAVSLPLVMLAQPAQAGSAQVSGKVGFLSEWELLAEVRESATAGRKDFSGPLTIKHVGLCAPGRTVEMSGEIRYRITGWLKPRMQATLVIEGIECDFDGALSKTYDGVISCPLWRNVPLSLSVKQAE